MDLCFACEAHLEQDRAGLKALDDPLALYRKPVVGPAVDAALAAKSLDAGIRAFKSGEYKEAERSLIDAARNDPADPVAWYYLGATRWALGKDDQAKEDFAQGAERERNSTRPARVVSGAISPIQGEVRGAIDKARP